MKHAFLVGLIALAPLGAQVTVIQNATIMSEGAKGTFKGSIVVKDGKITEVGDNVMVPAGATVIDAQGQYVIPGIIDCHSHIAVDGGVNEGSVSVSSMVNIRDVINPGGHRDLPRAGRRRDGGEYPARVGQFDRRADAGAEDALGAGRRRNDFPGRDAGNQVRAGRESEACGIPQGGRGAAPATNARYPATRMGVEDVIREAFNEAKQYKATWDAYDAAVAKGEHPLPPRKDLKLEPLKEVLEGKRFVHAHCYRADEILMLIRVADDYGFKIKTFQHVLEGYKVAKEIAAHGAGGSTFSDWWAYKVEAFDAIPYNAAIMTKKGVISSLNSDDAELMRRLNTEAAKAMKYGGLTREEALALVTINPAKQLGVDNRVGSIEVGKDADIVIYDKDPLSNFSKVQKVWIDGTKYFDRDSDVSGRPAKELEKKKLADKEKAATPARGGRGAQ